MKKEKRKRVTFSEVISCLFEQVFLRSVGSWGAFIVDENGNFVEDEDNSNNDQYLELHRTFGYGALFFQCLY